MNTQLPDDNIKNYFKSHKQEIDDNGFSDKVMNKLPVLPRKNSIIIFTFLFAGLLASMHLIDVNILSNLFTSLIESFSQLHFPSIQTSIAFIALFITIFVVVNTAMRESFE
jgi:hypothetical protein